MYAPECLGQNDAVSIKQLLALQASGFSVIPSDHCTDCMDVFELICGARGLTADKFQRLAIMALRADRMEGRIRYTIHIPTTGMVADGLTKVGTFLQLLGLCTTGVWSLPPDLQIRVRRRAPTATYSEQELETIEW